MIPGNLTNRGNVSDNQFPDLRKFQDPEGVTRLCSASATSKASSLHVVRDSQGRVWMMPNLLSGKLRVYGDPSAILVARTVEQGFGMTPETGWEAIFEQSGYPESVLREAKRYLAANPPIDWNAEPSAEESTETA